MKILDDYLFELSFKDKIEGGKEKIKDILVSMGILTSDEIKVCNNIIKNKKYIYLYHGTRKQYVESIKKDGLTLKNFKKRAKEEGDITLNKTPVLFFGNIYVKNKTVGFGGLGISNEVVYLIAKLNTKYIEKKANFFIYHRDVPPENLIWEGTNEFDKIGRESKCLEQR